MSRPTRLTVTATLLLALPASLPTLTSTTTAPAAAATTLQPTTRDSTAPTSRPAAIRIKAGLSSPLTDKAGNTWAPDSGFEGGDTIDRGSDFKLDPKAELKTQAERAPEFYRTERYDMTKFSQPLPNGAYTVNLYFAETYEEITAPGQRVFSLNVEGQDLKDFDITKEAGGPRKPILKSFTVDIKDNKLDITFTPKEQSPCINAIEILPQP